MKTPIFYTVLVTIASISCTQTEQKSADELLKNSEMRQKIFTSILNNNAYTYQFIDSLAKDKEKRNIILENDSLLQAICMSPKMDTLINTDSLTLNNMTKQLINKIAIDSVVCDRTCTQLMETRHFKNFLNAHSLKTK